MIDPKKINIHNKRAGFDFEIVQKFEAGILLTGTEIKAIREGGGSISEAFCVMRDGELYVKNMTIPEYSHGAYANHEPTRQRKLLLKKRELERIDAKMRERGFSIIPIRVYIGERNYAKVEIGLGRGKKKFDKRDSLKQKETKREMDRVLKKYR